MRALIDKLQRFALNKKTDGGQSFSVLPMAHLDELSRASREMQVIRDCCESLLAVAAATANSAYEFSESLGEMGSCLREKTVMNEGEDSGKVMSMMGEVQTELQEILDSYRSHILLTITNPSESLLNELRTVEDMKQQCDAKRDAYDHIITQLKGRRRTRNGKRQAFSSQQLQTARDEFNEISSLCIFRLKSLRQGLSQTLLTQAVRHYAAQLEFFRNGLESLESIEQHVRCVADMHHIDWSLSGIIDNAKHIDQDSEDEDTAELNELSFDYRINNTRDEAMPLPQNSLKMGRRAQGNGSHSAPLFPDTRFSEPADKPRITPQLKDSHSYVLPVPKSLKNPELITAVAMASNTDRSDFNRSPQPVWHSSPLVQIETRKAYEDGVFLKTSNRKGHNTHDFLTSTKLPLPRSEVYESDYPKRKGQIFSGPFKIKVSPTKPGSSTGVSPNVSPHRHSSPLIAGFHELPRPPTDAPNNGPKSPVLIGHSAPLGSRKRETSATNKCPPSLPHPPSGYARSYSIPSMSQRDIATLRVSKLLDSPRVPFKIQDFGSPPLSPIYFAKIRPATVQTGLG